MAWVMSQYLTKIPKKNITALSMLDHNRCVYQIAKKIKGDPATVRNIICWGNHSKTLYPDVTYGTIGGHPILSVIKDTDFIYKEFIEIIRNRAFMVQKQRQQTAGFSTAAAVRDHIKYLHRGTPSGEWVSMGVYTSGKEYDVDEDLYFSFPIICENKKYEIVEGFKWDQFAKEQIDASIKELKKEREECKSAIAGIEASTKPKP